MINFFWEGKQSRIKHHWSNPIFKISVNDELMISIIAAKKFFLVAMCFGALCFYLSLEIFPSRLKFSKFLSLRFKILSRNSNINLNLQQKSPKIQHSTIGCPVTQFLDTLHSTNYFLQIGSLRISWKSSHKIWLLSFFLFTNLTIVSDTRCYEQAHTLLQYDQGMVF